MSVIPKHNRLSKQEDCQFEARLGYVVKTCLLKLG